MNMKQVKIFILFLMNMAFFIALANENGKEMVLSSIFFQPDSSAVINNNSNYETYEDSIKRVMNEYKNMLPPMEQKTDEELLAEEGVQLSQTRYIDTKYNSGEMDSEKTYIKDFIINNLFTNLFFWFSIYVFYKTILIFFKNK